MAWLQTPPIAFGKTIDPAGAARALALQPAALHPDFTPQILSAGSPFLFIALRDRASVDAASLDEHALRTVADAREFVGVFFFAPVETGAYSRMCAPMSGIIEDPATGSASGPLGAYLVANGALPARDGLRFVSEQGVAMGRRSVIHGLLRVDSGTLRTVEIGGNAVKIGEGDLRL
jgi:trans-2,3-dihydro-3-hydroxyanthranilate isomerase